MWGAHRHSPFIFFSIFAIAKMAKNFRHFRHRFSRHFRHDGENGEFFLAIFSIIFAISPFSPFRHLLFFPQKSMAKMAMSPPSNMGVVVSRPLWWSGMLDNIFKTSLDHCLLDVKQISCKNIYPFSCNIFYWKWAWPFHDLIVIGSQAWAHFREFTYLHDLTHEFIS